MGYKERLEQIKDAIAHELGLTDDYMDGTYLYYLTRCKSAFAVGTMTLDDFKEIDEELLDDIFNAIEPFFIEQAERVQELELEVNDLRDEVKKWQRFYEESEESHLETMELLRSTLNQNKRLREALEFYASGNHYSDKLYDDKIILLDDGETARKALEGLK